MKVSVKPSLSQSTCAPNVLIAVKNSDVVASLAVLVLVGPDHILSSRFVSSGGREMWWESRPKNL